MLHSWRAKFVWVPLLACAAGCGVDPTPPSGHPDAMVTDGGAADAADGTGLPDGTTPEDVPVCSPSVLSEGVDPSLKARNQCAFRAGATAADTLGLDAYARAAIQIRHVVVVMQENRSFDHYLGQMPAWGRPDVDGIPVGYGNPDGTGRMVPPEHLPMTCVTGDPPHQWASMHLAWNNGRMDNFFLASVNGGGRGALALGYYDARDIPFYYWLYSTFAMADRYFAPSLAGTWVNRDFLYAGGSYGIHDTGEATLTGVRTVFDQLDDAGVRWGVYTDGPPRQDTLGWDRSHHGVHPTAEFFRQMQDGTLPLVVFVDPAGEVDEHPAADVQRGEAWVRRIVEDTVRSPLWPHMALVVTYDESGGFFDHVPPPGACPPSADDAAFNQRGVRVPMVVISPWVRPGYVSHAVHDHTSILRLIALLHDLPALTDRDANADALLDLFDFSCPHMARVPMPLPPAGTGGCPAPR